jgi:hypothetical protein
MKKPKETKELKNDEKITLTKKERKEFQPLHDKILDSVFNKGITTSQPIKNGKPNK